MSPNANTNGTNNGAPISPIDAAIKEADKTLKRQKTCAAKTSGTMYKLIHSIEQCIHRISTDPSIDPAMAVEELGRTVDSLDAVATLSTDTKELHGAVAKLGKIIDKEFDTDICGAFRQVNMDKATLDRVVAEHLFHEGMFDVADALVAEAGIPKGDALKAPYASMHAVLEELAKKNLAPAMAWAEENKGALRALDHRHHQYHQYHDHQNGNEDSSMDVGEDVHVMEEDSTSGSTFEFALHRLGFLQALEQQGPAAALAYARLHFPPFQPRHLAQIQRLMGALACYKRATARASATATSTSTVSAPVDGPYVDLLGPAAIKLWDQIKIDFQRQSCLLMGQAEDSPLLVTVAAGAAALPTLLKLASVVSKTQSQSTTELMAGAHQELPVEVPLGREFVFHSIFACPVSREQSSVPDNPPMMLPCGHCLSKHSVLRVAKSVTRAFKCPYCPREATLQQCMELSFPDVV